eukprot:CAMPEP_0114577490 /NCGR_PEP_ID=MMETSP0125-20121206/2139_1 /TAXON_ID=485358 ORGANISM="Aristerostoma sp., Strain ATCC 50986" /NCGR_SAMPLE_ID=MMETSP0125 /ASSEMBLY_ACC=CAM_ASM_000245 /LENGTH=185 /DNA_ID=CAMNT_0001766831 /DNA_START=1197 /DNA_END=1754 /DNA_ORIENTATION=+
MSSRPIAKQWIVDESHGITITDYTSGVDDTEVDIPACDLEAHTSYSFRYEAYFDEYSDTKKTYKLDVIVTNLPFTVEIDNDAVNEIFSYEPLSFTSTFDPECPVADPDDILYKWNCTVANSEEGPYKPCDDPDEKLFEFKSQQDELYLDEDYYNPGQYVKVFLTIKVGEDEEDSNEIVVKVSPYI